MQHGGLPYHELSGPIGHVFTQEARRDGTVSLKLQYIQLAPSKHVTQFTPQGHGWQKRWNTPPGAVDAQSLGSTRGTW